MRIPRLIGITGYARHGKDTIASVLVKDSGYNRIALADKMREALLALDPIVYASTDPLDAGVVERLSDHVEAGGWDEAKKLPEVRRLMQYMGTEAGRKVLGEDVWIEALAKGFRGFYNDECRIVIPDIRFVNEARWIARCGGEVWLVQRPGFDNGVGTGHASEQEIPQIVPDVVFVNQGTEDDLRYHVRLHVKSRVPLSWP